MNLYVTADTIGRPDHGGGTVTFNESDALASLGECRVWGRQLDSVSKDPWDWDDNYLYKIQQLAKCDSLCDPQIAHFYAGTFSKCVDYLRKGGVKVTYTAAAHRIEDSRAAHEEFGVPYAYPHLTEPDQWKRYLQGYLDADVLIVPSQHSAEVKREYGRTGPIEVIPHGHNPPQDVKPMLDDGIFRVGYLGSFGPDKGVRYLLEAWKRLNYDKAVLVLAGADSTSQFVYHLIHQYGGGAINCLGFVKNIGDFYNRINVYVQPSATEGFGLEVLEAMSYGRPVICSDHAGAVDLIRDHKCGQEFPAKNVSALCELIEVYRRDWHKMKQHGNAGREASAAYMWEKIRARYVEVWKGLCETS